MAALSFSSWLQATHTNVAYRLPKAISIHKMKRDATPCVMEDLIILMK
jgi:hypothetical protein